jgi:hypothetical protein
MRFPSYVHAVIPSSDADAWPVQGQGVNECGITVVANALNLLVGRHVYDKDDLIREAGWLFQRSLGGSPSPETGRLLKRHGVGTHFGNLRRTNAEAVLRDLVDRRVPVVVEIGTNRVGPFAIYGQHSILLVGYSDPHPDRNGTLHEDYYFVDAQWPRLGAFTLAANDTDVDGNPTPMPGNRTMASAELLQWFQTGIYFPVFPSQEAHDRWYNSHMRPFKTAMLTGSIVSTLLTGTTDVWNGAQQA